MFPQKYKLHLRSFVDFFLEARKIRTGFFTAFVRPADTPTKLVVIVPKRVVALSSARIATKRLLYTKLQQNIEKVALLTLNIAIVVQRPISADVAEQAVLELVTTVERMKRTTL